MTRQPPTIIERTDGSRSYLNAELDVVEIKLRSALQNRREADFDGQKIAPKTVLAIRQGDQRLEASELLKATRKKKDRK